MRHSERATHPPGGVTTGQSHLPASRIGRQDATVATGGGPRVMGRARAVAQRRAPPRRSSRSATRAAQKFRPGRRTPSVTGFKARPPCGRRVRPWSPCSASSWISSSPTSDRAPGSWPNRPASAPRPASPSGLQPLAHRGVGRQVPGTPGRRDHRQPGHRHPLAPSRLATPLAPAIAHPAAGAAADRRRPADAHPSHVAGQLHSCEAGGYVELRRSEPQG